MKKNIILLLIVLMSLSSIAFADNSRSPIERIVRVVIDNESISFLDQNPIIENDRVLVPLRAVSESLGFDVKWINATQEIMLTKQESNISYEINMKLGDSTIWTKKTDEKAKRIYYPRSYFRNYELDSPAKVVNGRTLVPLRIISEIIGCKIEWDKEAYKVTITKEKNNLEYLEVSHYNNNTVKKIKNENLENAILEAFINGEPYKLAILDVEIDLLYQVGNFLELNPDMDRGKDILKLNNNKAKKIIVVLEDHNNFSKGMVLTLNEIDEIRAWGTNIETFSEIIKNIN